MASRYQPITISLAITALLHVAVLFVILPPLKTTGNTEPGLSVELVAAQTLRSPEVSAVKAEATVRQQVQVEAKAENRKRPAVIHASHRDAVVSSDNTLAAKPVQRDRDRVQPRLQNTASSVAASNNAQSDALLEMLHTAIDQHKRYPYLAKRQRREGTVRVGFAIDIDGRINQLSVVDSSRSLMLDEAALAAVTKIQPFTPAQRMLDRRQEFQVDIVFSML